MNSESKLEIRLKYETYCYSNAIKSKIQKCIIMRINLMFDKNHFNSFQNLQEELYL